MLVILGYRAVTMHSTQLNSNYSLFP